MKEYILCAAIWFDNKVKYPNQPENIETGIVFCGFKHAAIYQQVCSISGGDFLMKTMHENGGFLTNKNRYVSREEALKIAIDAHQINDINKIKRGNLSSGNLYQSDIYIKN